MINNHPSLELITEYSSGSLRLSHALCIAAHIEQCDQCASQAAKLSRVGANLFEQQQPIENADIHQKVKDKLMGMLEGIPNFSIEKRGTVAVDMDASTSSPCQVDTGATTFLNHKQYKIPKSLQQFVDTDYDNLHWVSVSPSIKIAELCRDSDGSQVALTRVKPGGKMPRHWHTGDELTTILEGSFSDEYGIYKKGDFIAHSSDHKHQPVVSKDAECICLTVLDAPIQFTSLFTRWLNPLLRRQYRMA